MVMINLYEKHKKRHRYAEETFGLCGRRRGCDVLREQHRTCILSSVKQITSPGWMHETSGQGCALGRPRGMGWRGRWEGGSGWVIHVNPWLIHVKVWQNPLQYCKIISPQLIKINGKKKLFDCVDHKKL